MTTANYLEASEFQDYGIQGIAEDRMTNACLVLDAYLSRPEGLTHTLDSSGFPLYMTRKLPSGSFKIQGAIAPGTSVPVAISNGQLIEMGQALVLDRTVDGSTEVCYVSSITDANHVVLAKVEKSHLDQAVVECGLTCEETLHVSKGRSYVTLQKSPLVRLISAMGRVQYSRRGSSGGDNPFALLASVQQFGGAPLWQQINVQASDVDLGRNQVWLPAGVLMAPYNEVRVAYVSGFPTTQVPQLIKRAAATLAKAINDAPAASSISTFKAGEVQMERFIASAIDDDLRRMLSPYTANLYG